MLIVPPEHVPVVVRVQLEHPEQVPPADEHAEFVYLPLHVFVPLPVRVPLVILVVVVQDVVLLVFETLVHGVLHVCVFMVHVHDELDTEQFP